MEVAIFVPPEADMTLIEREYPDLVDDGDGRYFVGNSADEERDYEWLTYNEAVACCGFVEGALPGAEALIEGNGGWAQSMISRRDFSRLAISEEDKCAYRRTSNLFWKHFKRGREARKAPSVGRGNEKHLVVQVPPNADSAASVFQQREREQP